MFIKISKLISRVATVLSKHVPTAGGGVPSAALHLLLQRVHQLVHQPAGPLLVPEHEVVAVAAAGRGDAAGHRQPVEGGRRRLPGLRAHLQAHALGGGGD